MLLPKPAEFFNQDFLTNIHILLNESKTEPLKIDISTATTAENTENSLVSEERDTRDFDFDAELDDLLSRLDLEDFLNSNSPEYFHFWNLLECELADEQSDLSDFLSHLALESENAQIVDQNDYDFECGVLNIDNLHAKGLSESILKFVSEGIPVDFKAGFSTDRIRPKPNSRHVSQNRDIVAKVIASLVRSGHVSPVAEKPAVLCPLNVIPKSNGSLRLIHNLCALNQGMLHGPRVSQPNLFALARSWSRSTFFCKIDLRHGYYHLKFHPSHAKFFGFSFERQYFVWNSLCFGWGPATDYFQSFMGDIGRILSDHGIENAIKLDHLLIWSDSFESCLEKANLAVELLNHFGLKINLDKSVLVPCQKLIYLGFLLDSSTCSFRISDQKRAKGLLILKVLERSRSVSVRSLQKVLGFYNFLCELVPYFRSFFRVWYSQLRICRSGRLYFSRLPLLAIRDLLTSPNFAKLWAGDLAEYPLICCSDATPAKVAFVSSRGVFSRSLPRQLPILQSEFLAGYIALNGNLQVSNNILLCADNLSVLYSIKKGASRSTPCNFILQQMGYLYLKAPFSLSLAYIPSEINLADKFTRQ